MVQFYFLQYFLKLLWVLVSLWELSFFVLIVMNYNFIFILSWHDPSPSGVQPERREMKNNRRQSKIATYKNPFVVLEIPTKREWRFHTSPGSIKCVWKLLKCEYIDFVDWIISPPSRWINYLPLQCVKKFYPPSSFLVESQLIVIG